MTGKSWLSRIFDLSGRRLPPQHHRSSSQAPDGNVSTLQPLNTPETSQPANAGGSPGSQEPQHGTAHAPVQGLAGGHTSQQATQTGPAQSATTSQSRASARPGDRTPALTRTQQLCGSCGRVRSARYHSHLQRGLVDLPLSNVCGRCAREGTPSEDEAETENRSRHVRFRDPSPQRTRRGQPMDDHRESSTSSDSGTGQNQTSRPSSHMMRPNERKDKRGKVRAGLSNILYEISHLLDEDDDDDDEEQEDGDSTSSGASTSDDREESSFAGSRGENNTNTTRLGQIPRSSRVVQERRGDGRGSVHGSAFPAGNITPGGRINRDGGSRGFGEPIQERMRGRSVSTSLLNSVQSPFSIFSLVILTLPS